MADKTQDGGNNATDDNNSQAQDSGTDDAKSDKSSKDVLDLFENNPLVKAEMDRRARKLQTSLEAEFELKQHQATEKAKREAQEAKLLDDKKFEELAILKAKEADEWKEKFSERERGDKVDLLLDKEEIVAPKMRKLFKATKLDLVDLDPLVQSFKEDFNAAVKAEVDKRLSTDPPPKNTNTPPSPGDLDAQIEAAAKKGDMQEFTRLKRERFNNVTSGKS